ncbi:peptidoglycan-associated lipoprotein [Chlorobaculum limnaeum]|uniref:Peptidoglycan-associated lipoprotein n=2 Tax=Chlorobaculum limnaeum TaxID=274537 RepID=A0A1D8D679_CHLLM|nr:peptidoglycan-associated lipoprotein Pal [Chlorobaculum limnaeum]AOS85057.1 peptidoglycan-associated lipoprotein [Chlorobaculum limnaeum]
MTNIKKITKRAMYVPAMLLLGACCTTQPEAVKPLPPPPAPVAPLGDIFFDFDRSGVTSEGDVQLKKNAEWMAANMGKSVVIEGHCDERGTSEYNMALGQRRADSAMDAMVSLGADQARMTAISYGEEKPFDTGHNEAEWSQNRRAHFVEK